MWWKVPPSGSWWGLCLQFLSSFASLFTANVNDFNPDTDASWPFLLGVFTFIDIYEAKNPQNTEILNLVVWFVVQSRLEGLQLRAHTFTPQRWTFATPESKVRSNAQREVVHNHRSFGTILASKYRNWEVRCDGKRWKAAAACLSMLPVRMSFWRQISHVSTRSGHLF